MQKPEAAEVRRRLANDSEGLQSGFSLDGMRGIKQERGFGKRDKPVISYSGGCGEPTVNMGH